MLYWIIVTFTFSEDQFTHVFGTAQYTLLEIKLYNNYSAPWS